jgi:hypothetical protein
MMFIGFLICFDSFLYIFTILPLRVLIAFLLFLKSWVSTSVKLNSCQKTDLLKGTLVVLCAYFAQFLDPSRMYHSIRGQAILKLYVIFNVLEVFVFIYVRYVINCVVLLGMIYWILYLRPVMAAQMEGPQSFV